MALRRQYRFSPFDDQPGRLQVGLVYGKSLQVRKGRKRDFLFRLQEHADQCVRHPIEQRVEARLGETLLFAEQHEMLV